MLVLDAGDFLMGSLFHMVAREESLELGLLQAMGYDAVALGNHEFDLMPDGLARILSAAAGQGRPAAGAFRQRRVRPRRSRRTTAWRGLSPPGWSGRYEVIEKGGVRFGLFALMGKDAAEVSPFASPVKFRDPIEVAKEMVALLREQEKAEVVICLSHSGLSKDPDKSEDVLLAREVPGIDIIVSGHTHTRLDAPILVGRHDHRAGLGATASRSGVLDFAVDAGKVSLLGWKTVALDDSAAGDPAHPGPHRVVQAHRGPSASWPRTAGPTARSWPKPAFDLKAAEAETGLGNLVADSIRWYVDRVDSDPAEPSSRVTLAVESGGVIRDEILRGTTGRLTMADLFRVLPLGVGLDGSMAYPLISVYLTGAEIRKALEIVASVHPLKGSDYFLQVSGVRFTYNPRRVLFDRVSRVEIGSEEAGLDAAWTPPGGTPPSTGWWPTTTTRRS